MIYKNHDDEDIKKAVNWFIEHQEKNGLWKISYSNIHKNTQTSKTKEAQLWITLVICRILKRIFFIFDPSILSRAFVMISSAVSICL